MKVLFVCTGNICRSPFAELLLADRSARAGLGLSVSSAGTRALNGQPVHPEIGRLLSERGIESDGFESRMLTASLARDADLVLGLTRDHRAIARQLVPVRWKRMTTLREASVTARTTGDVLHSSILDPTDPSLDIVDPIRQSTEVFGRVANEISACLDQLAIRLRTATTHSLTGQK